MAYFLMNAKNEFKIIKPVKLTNKKGKNNGFGNIQNANINNKKNDFHGEKQKTFLC